MKFELGLYYIVEAKFAPKETDNLIEGSKEWIGKKTTWQAVGVVGVVGFREWMMMPDGPDRHDMPFAWVPERDLEIIRVIRS